MKLFNDLSSEIASAFPLLRKFLLGLAVERAIAHQYQVKRSQQSTQL